MVVAGSIYAATKDKYQSIKWSFISGILIFQYKGLIGNLHFKKRTVF
jgi:hypothetical protein